MNEWKMETPSPGQGLCWGWGWGWCRNLVGPGQTSYPGTVAAASWAGGLSHEEPITELQAGLSPPRTHPPASWDSLLRACRAAALFQGRRQRKWLLKLNMTACQREGVTTGAPFATIKLPVSAGRLGFPRRTFLMVRTMAETGRPLCLVGRVY